MKHYIYVGLILALLGFAKWYSDRQFDAGVAVTEAKYEKALRAAEKQAEADRNHSQAAINSITQLWLEKKPVIKEVKVYEETIKYVAANRHCNLTRGAVRLLNDSRDPERLQDGFHPSLTDAEASEPSTVTQRESVRSNASCGAAYTTVASQLVALQATVGELECVH